MVAKCHQLEPVGVFLQCRKQPIQVPLFEDPFMSARPQAELLSVIRIGHHSAAALPQFLKETDELLRQPERDQIAEVFTDGKES